MEGGHHNVTIYFSVQSPLKSNCTDFGYFLIYLSSASVSSGPALTEAQAVLECFWEGGVVSPVALGSSGSA